MGMRALRFLASIKAECKLCQAGWDWKEYMFEVASTGTLDGEGGEYDPSSLAQGVAGVEPTAQAPVIALLKHTIQAVWPVELRRQV